MVEIYSYDITTHERFARDQQEVEAFRKQYHIETTGTQLIAIQTKVLDFVPKHSAIVLLMQTYQRKLWARFVIPPNYYTQRFASSYVAPSLGSREKQDADILRLQLYLRKRADLRIRGEEKKEREGKDEEEVVEEGEVLIELLEKGVKETNQMVDFVTSHMYQFVQA